MKHALLLSLLLPLALPAALGAQTPPTRADSLEAELRRLRARMDSLQAVVQRLVREGRDSAAAEPRDELARLRAAAAAAGRRDTARTRTAAVSQPGNLNRLNPEISVTGDFRVQTDPDAWYQDNFEVKEFEFSFQSALDPYASTKVFLAWEEGEIRLEEGYLYWSGLPGNLRLDAGRLRQQAGELNRWHLHALPESDYPLVYQTYFGEEGLVGDGVRLSWLAPTGGVFGVQELTVEGTVGRNEVLFDDGNRPTVLGHLNNFFELSPATFFQVGGTALYGKVPEAGLRTTLFGGDVRFSWRPPEQALYRSFTIRGEGYWLKKDFGAGEARTFGAFAGAQYQLDRRWHVGARYDYVEPVAGGRPTWAIVPHVTWWQSEWAYLHAEWQHVSTPLGASLRETGNRLLLQIVWSVGPHKHETY